MKNVAFLLLASLLLAACSKNERPVVGVDPVRVPALPAELNKQYGDLPPITDNTMGGIVNAEAEASIAYNDVATSYNNLVALYTCIREAINNSDKESLQLCLGEDSSGEESTPRKAWFYTGTYCFWTYEYDLVEVSR